MFGFVFVMFSRGPFPHVSEVFHPGFAVGTGGKKFAVQLLIHGAVILTAVLLRRRKVCEGHRFNHFSRARG